MEKKKKQFLAVFLLMVLISITFPSNTPAQSEGGDSIAVEKARYLAEKLSPEEKVGQLFLVTYQGIDVSENSQIYDLIINNYIGGVVLNRENNNFIGPESTIEEAYSSVFDLQNAIWQARGVSLLEKEEVITERNYVPIFVGISQEGDSYPYDQILNGLTQIPNQMAIGATFDTNIAEEIGRILGRELHALGINLIFGPSLDVLDINFSETSNDLGTRTFGGDPYWVGEMGKAYIKGIHEGSSNQIAVIAKYFPGRGNSDRLPEEEVATVRKSLEQLKLIELAPFFSVTNMSDSDPSVITDGLLLSHIRYQGFQGNIRATTKPVSFDSLALDLLMSLPEFLDWRDQGGVLVSDDLGSDAVGKFFNPTGKFFDARQVAINAFLAGNDLLYVNNFISTGDSDSYTTIMKTLDLFAQKYREDKAFADRVDIAVVRILALKYKFYGTFNSNRVLPKQIMLSTIGEGNEIVFETASKAVTLIDPREGDILNTIPEPPGSSDRLVFIVDNIASVQCDTCVAQEIFSITEMHRTVLRLYGLQGSGQINDNRVLSYSFADLMEYLDNPFNRLDFETNISNSDWLIFALLDVKEDRMQSIALKRLISERPDLIREKKVVVFAFNAPYYLDATDITSLTAYYGLYSKVPEFIEVAARVLLQEIKPSGHSPVSIPGVGYDLITIMSPDTAQIICLEIDTEQLKLKDEEGESVESTENELFFKVGDILPVKTGVIMDHNGNPVPDGTVARFILNHIGETESIQQFETTTVNGIARVSFPIQAFGRLEIRVISEPALESDILVLDISSEEGGIVSAITPTPVPTLAEDMLSSSGEDIIEEQVSDEAEGTDRVSPILEWLLVSTFIWGIGIGIFRLGKRYLTLEMSVPLAFSAIICGYLSFIGIIFGFSSGFLIVDRHNYFLLTFMILVGISLGGLIAWLFLKRKLGKK
jgi:beta-N-acetylhexosaminidase